MRLSGRMAAVSGLRQPRGTAFALRDPFPWREFSALARRGEELGYAGVFLPEIGGRDVLAALAALAGETERLALATGIVPMMSRTVRLTAMAGATVQERSGGRAILGLGTGHPASGALGELRRRVLNLRRAFAGERMDAGEGIWRLGLDPGGPVPIWISALGPAAVRLAGEVADGVLLNWCTPERVAVARDAVREAADRAGRDPDAVTVAVYVRASPGGGGSEALRRAAAEYASYPAYARQFRAMGLGNEAEAAAEEHRSAGPHRGAAALVRAVCLPDEPREAAGRLRAYREAGAHLPVVYPVAGEGAAPASLRATIEALAPA
jgi:alkanesulfonate monooxygenase SsuD/methylene tetrahydromethanopterin reductase-like flavin-dependent oxidoreductase (luciferase family)